MPDTLVRPIEDGDVPTVVGLMHGLATFEDMAQECVLTDGQLREALFGDPPVLHGRVACHDGEIVGAVLWFVSFATFRGAPAVVVDKIYISPDHRAAGIGHALFRAVAQECTDRGYACIEGRALDWNEDAVQGYRTMGAEPLDAWTVYRLSGEPLHALAGSPPPG